MSPKKKSRSSRPRASHVKARHGTPALPPDPSPPLIASRELGDAEALTVEIVKDPAEQRCAERLLAWNALGVSLAAHGPHRLALAMHIVEVNACGAHGVSAEEEDRIATWFGDAYELAVTRTGGAKPQCSGDEDRNVNPAAAAIWHLLAADLAGGASTEPRCFAVGAVPCPGDPGHLQGMRGAVEGYVRTVIAGADADTIVELRQILTMSDRLLEEYRPLGCYFGEGYPDPIARENVLENLSRRRPSIEQICRAVEGWALWYRDEVIAHNIPPIHRLAAIAWLARVALREESAPM